jgi:hypothetical protein
MSVVGSSSIVHVSSSFARLAASASAGPVVSDRSRHHEHVDVLERERGREHRVGRRRRDHLDPRRRGHGEVRREQHDVGAAAPRFLRDRHAHPAGRPVADEAHGVDGLARAAGGDEYPAAGERRRRQQLLDARRDLVRLGHPADAPLALGHLALVGPTSSTPRATSVSTFARVAASPTCAGSSPARASTGPGARARPR